MTSTSDALRAIEVALQGLLIQRKVCIVIITLYCYKLESFAGASEAKLQVLTSRREAKTEVIA